MISKSKNRISGLDQAKEAVATIGFVLPAARENSGNSNQKRVPSRSTKTLSFQSKVMHEFYQLANLFAQSSASVLVTGESGTGKELFSRLIHDRSQRHENRFVAVNCAAIPEALMESEIFGHERGAFTGAAAQRIGHFELASGGTLLLDEISEIPISMQAKLLRVIEEQEVQPVGSNQTRPIDVRIVATTNRDLSAEVANGRFRSDLYHRLNVVELKLPPLRERVADIPLLAMHFVSLFQGESRSGVLKVGKEAMQLLCEYHWPGNVRELRNVIHRACIVAVDGEISVAALPAKLEEKPEPIADPDSFAGMTLADVERRLILASLKKFNGSKRLAANELGVTPRTLGNKLKQYEENGLLSDR